MTQKQLENKYILARRAFENKHFNEAYSYYKEILDEEPNDFEANFRFILSNAHISTLASFKEVTHSLSFETSRLLKSDYIQELNAAEQLSIISRAEKDFTDTIIACERAATAHYTQFSSLPNSISEFRSQMIQLSSACGLFGETIYDTFQSDEIKKICVTPLKNAVTLLKNSAYGLTADVFNSSIARTQLGNYTYKIQQFEKDYINPCYEAMRKATANSNAKSTTSNGLNPAAKFSLWLSIACIVGGIISCCCGGATAIGVGAGLIFFGVMFILFVPTINGN